jgi:hypothetical protein
MPIVKLVSGGRNSRQKEEVSPDYTDVNLYTNLNWSTELGANQLEIQKQLAQANAPICPEGVVGCHLDHSYTDVHGRIIKDCNMCLSNCEIQAEDANVSVHNAKAIYDKYGKWENRMNDIKERYPLDYAPPPPKEGGAHARPDNPANVRQVVKIDTAETSGELHPKHHATGFGQRGLGGQCTKTTDCKQGLVCSQKKCVVHPTGFDPNDRRHQAHVITSPSGPPSGSPSSHHHPVAARPGR